MEATRRRGDDPDGLIDLYIRAINEVVKSRPDNITIGFHLCRRNFAEGMADGGYEPIAEKLFNELNVGAFFLEYDTPRAGDFRPLRHLPSPRKLVLGLISIKRPELENKDIIKRRIDEAARFVDLIVYVCHLSVGLPAFLHARASECQCN